MPGYLSRSLINQEMYGTNGGSTVSRKEWLHLTLSNIAISDKSAAILLVCYLLFSLSFLAWIVKFIAKQDRSNNCA